VRHELFPLADIEPGQMRPVTVDGIDIVVARLLDGSFGAIFDRCPHAGAKLSKGRLLERIDGDDVDEYRMAGELVIKCPWHGYEFDVTSGRCHADPQRVRVRPYPVTVEDGIVCIELRAGGRRVAAPAG
jgi:3-phenylpropionate/trans-cinnamate dioxygenase ferredoxin subunit